MVTYQQVKERACAYLKSKIADEELEFAQYRGLERDARMLTNGHVFLDVLFRAQDTELKELKTLYREMCGGA